MLMLLAFLGTSFALTLVITPILRSWAARVGLVDRPDGRRKLHRQAVPLAGGLAILISSVAVLSLGVTLSNPWQQLLQAQSDTLVGLLLAAIVICAVGVADDWRGMRGRHKLFGQLLAVSIVISSGVEVENVHLFGWEIMLGPLALPLTAFWLLGAINSLNLLDGLDGLLGSVGAIICLALVAMAVASGHWATAAVAACLLGALLAFLCFNFPPASIYLGDCGSMLIGLVVGVLAIQSSLKAPATVAMAAPAALMTIPIFDSLAAITRRRLTGRSIYTTDRGHIHHSMLSRGLSGTRVLLVIGTLCSLIVVGVLASLILRSELLAVIAGLTVVFVLIVTRLFGHAEFLLLKERLLECCTPGRQVNGRTRQMEVRLQGSADWKLFWLSLTTHAEDLKLQSMCLDVNAPAIHESYHARWGRSSREEEMTTLWRAELPLMVNGQVIGRLELTGLPDEQPISSKVATLSTWVEAFEIALSRLTESRSDSGKALTDSHWPNARTESVTEADPISL